MNKADWQEVEGVLAAVMDLLATDWASLPPPLQLQWEGARPRLYHVLSRRREG